MVKDKELFGILKFKAAPDIDIKAGWKQFQKIVKTAFILAKNAHPTVNLILKGMMLKYELIEDYYCIIVNCHPKVAKWLKPFYKDLTAHIL